MSDPVTNVEIEDVLSSIRRLLADKTMPAGPAPAAVTDRFVLTPALRVGDRVDETSEPADNVIDSDDRWAADLPAPDPTEDRDPEWSAAADANAQVNGAADDQSGIVARLAARIEAAVTTQDVDWEPDGSEDVPVMDWSTPPPEDAPVFRSRNPSPFRLVGPVPAVPPAEEVVFQHRGYAEPAAEAEARGTPDDGGPDDDGLDPDVAALFGQETVVDEDTLRALVAEIVRQELQGELGERITRNVRKLVRREIYRVLSSQQLD